jgi:hypothetical protein
MNPRLTCCVLCCLLWGPKTLASDHLDTPTVIADPAADIADLYTWMSPDGQRVNLVMTLVAHQFSNRVQYVFHVDSGARLGATTASTSIICQFDVTATVECWAGGSDYARGDASHPAGLESQQRRFRVFAGLRDDPFFNNVRGTRAMWGAVSEGLKSGVPLDAAGCPHFDAATSRAIADRWAHTEGAAPKNFLRGWTSAALVISIDRELLTSGGPFLAVWAGTHRS